MLDYQHGLRKRRYAIARVLPNRSVCFAGRKLPHKMPLDIQGAGRFREILNTFIMLLRHNHGENFQNIV